MGLHEYLVSQEIEREDYPFYSLVMALVRKADTDNLEKLRVAFPETVKELEKRYHVGAGILPEDLTQKARFSLRPSMEGRIGTFEHSSIRGTFWIAAGEARVLSVAKPEEFEVLTKGEWIPLNHSGYRMSELQRALGEED